MRKNILLLMFLVLLVPVYVWAEECDSSKISLGSLELVGSKVAGVDNVDIENGASIVDNKIVLNLNFSSVNDYAQYSFVIKNDSNEDYELTDKSITIDSDYIDYTLSTDDNLNIIKAGEEKTVLLNIKYSKEVDSSSFKDGSYTESKIMNLNYSYDKKSNPIADIIENPKTGVFKYFLVLVALILSILLIIKERRRSKVILLLLVLGLIPISIKALCTCNIAVESNVVIEKKMPKLLSFIYKMPCGSYSFNFEFEEGITFGDLIESDSFSNSVRQKGLENGEKEEYIDGYINTIKINIISDFVSMVNSNDGNDSIDGDNDDVIEYNENNINDYVLEENYDLSDVDEVC